MLSSIFPDAPHEQHEGEQEETLGSYFAEFLPEGFTHRHTTGGKQQHPPAASAFASEAAQQQPDQPHAAAPAGATAATCTTSSTHQRHTASAQPQQQQQRPVGNGYAHTAAAAAAGGGGGGDASSTNSDWFDLPDWELPDFDLPRAGDVTQRISKALFGDGDPATDDGVLEKLFLPFHTGSTAAGSNGLCLPAWRRRPPKPLRMKIAEQVLSKQVLSAVQLIDEQILSAKDPLPNATIRFFLKAGESMWKGWARQHAGQAFAAFGAYVAASCGLFHAGKVATKWLVRRLPRVGGRRLLVPAVDFAADILLPSSFFGPLLATYVLVRLVAKQQAKQHHEAEDAAVQTGDPAAAAGGAAAPAAAVAAGDGATAGSVTVKRQQSLRQQQRTRSREVQLQLCVAPVVPPAPPLLRRRSGRATSVGRSGSLRTRAWRRLAGTTPAAAAASSAAADAAAARPEDADVLHATTAAVLDLAS